MLSSYIVNWDAVGFRMLEIYVVYIYLILYLIRGAALCAIEVHPRTSRDTLAKLHKLQVHTAAHAFSLSIHVVSTASPGFSKHCAQLSSYVLLIISHISLIRSTRQLFGPTCVLQPFFIKNPLTLLGRKNQPPSSAYSRVKAKHINGPRGGGLTANQH